jgi:hypothetical protein
MKFAAVLACLSALAVTACTHADPEEIAGDDLAEQVRHDQRVMDEPIAVLDLTAGQHVSFFAWPDGSAGVMSESALDDVALLDELELDHLSVAEVFWGLSAPGTEIPAALQRHHDLMIADDGRDTPLGATEQGWMIERLDGLRAGGGHARGYAACDNDTFSDEICTSATYPDGPSCHFDQSGTRTWTTGVTSRFRAGFCLDEGSAISSLWYDTYHSDCTVTKVYHGIWGGLGSTVYDANIYLNWWWIGPSGAAKRVWGHRAEGVSGANFDWGTKFLTSSSCGPI